MIFKNDSDLPVYVEVWEYIFIGLSGTKDILIGPGETKKVKSITGECNVHIMFSGGPEKNLWNDYIKEKNISHLNPYLGKFKKYCTYSGENVWMETNQFLIEKNEEEIFVFKKLVN